MIEIMVTVRDSETGAREHHVTDVLVDATDLYETVEEDTWDEIQRVTRNAVTAAVRRLADQAEMRKQWKDWHKV